MYEENAHWVIKTVLTQKRPRKPIVQASLMTHVYVYNGGAL